MEALAFAYEDPTKAFYLSTWKRKPRIFTGYRCSRDVSSSFSSLGDGLALNSAPPLIR